MSSSAFVWSRQGTGCYPVTPVGGYAGGVALG